MKNMFSSYYHPTDKEFSVLWEKCIFVLDANMLLNLYRYSKETSEELISILKQISDRLWIPHQTGLEYQRQRLSVIAQQLEAYDDILEFLNKTKNQITDKFNSLHKHPYIDVDNHLKIIQDAFDTIEMDLNLLKKKHPDLSKNDDLRDTLSTLLEGKVGSPYPIDRLNEIYKEGKQRYEQEIPPGYKDINKEGTKRYGDLILWLQVIDKAKETNKPIILITDDRKDDWWLRSKGLTISPRPELIDEMHKEANVMFYLYQADPFMEHAQKFLETKVKQNAINEIRNIRHQDELYEQNIQSITGSLFRLSEEVNKTGQVAQKSAANLFAILKTSEDSLKIWQNSLLKVGQSIPPLYTTLTFPSETSQSITEIETTLPSLQEKAEDKSNANILPNSDSK